MMKRTLLLTLLALLNLPVFAGDIVVIVNNENSVSELSKREVIDLYMGKKLNFPDGENVNALDQEMDSDIRETFYKSLVNKSVPQVNAYWARLLFTGRVKPPKTLADSTEILQWVQNTPQAIGYIDSTLLDDSVKEVYRIPRFN